MTRGANGGPVTSSFRGSTAAPARLVWFDFLYLWLMDFDCAHRNLPASPFRPLAGSGRRLQRYSFAISKDIFVEGCFRANGVRHGCS